LIKSKLLDIYNRLFDRFSYQYWWPADTKDEIVIGAILTQNTAWSNVEKAIKNLKEKKLCSLEAIHKSDIELLKECIKPAGFFNQKSNYIKNIAEYFAKNGSYQHLSKQSTKNLRERLLGIKGVGKETADSILLYVFERPVFVVDAYTKRLIKRHNLLDDADYDSIQSLFMDNLNGDVELFKEYHALIVKNAKEYCKTKPLCGNCPLKGV
jgi:endonuclease-3 related protein